jgi:hypothetical protein
VAALLLVGLAAPAASAAPAARDILARTPEASAARKVLLADLAQALGAARSMDPDQRSTAVALVLGQALCPDTLALADVSPEQRGETLLAACGPFLPADADGGVLLAAEGCRPLLGSLSQHAQRLVLGPGALLLLAWKQEGMQAADGLPSAGCRMAMIPAMLGPVRADVPAVTSSDVGLRVAVDAADVRLTLTDGRGLRLAPDGATGRAEVASKGEAITIAALQGPSGPSVDRAALQAAAVAVHALLGTEARTATVVASPDTAYKAIVAVLDAIRDGGASGPLFPHVTFGVDARPGEPTSDR